MWLFYISFMIWRFSPAPSLCPHPYSSTVWFALTSLRLWLFPEVIQEPCKHAVDELLNSTTCWCTYCLLFCRSFLYNFMPPLNESLGIHVMLDPVITVFPAHLFLRSVEKGKYGKENHLIRIQPIVFKHF